MAKKCASIGVVAPACGIDQALAAKVTAFAAERYGADGLTLSFHPQCFLREGHFAGPDEVRKAAFLEMANDTAIDAVWFARGGYGACRFGDEVFEELNAAALAKTYLGYSDMGFLLGRLYAEKIGRCIHGPMPSDFNREGGQGAVVRALDFLVGEDESTLEPDVLKFERRAAFNITILSHLVGTAYEPDLTDHVLVLEDIAEYHYRIDRALFTIFSSPKMAGLKGVMLGRCSDIPENEPAFEASEEEIIQYWCSRKGISYFGRADIGHDVDNKIVVFG